MLFPDVQFQDFPLLDIGIPFTFFLSSTQIHTVVSMPETEDWRVLPVLFIRLKLFLILSPVLRMESLRDFRNPDPRFCRPFGVLWATGISCGALFTDGKLPLKLSRTFPDRLCQDLRTSRNRGRELERLVLLLRFTA